MKISDGLQALGIMTLLGGLVGAAAIYTMGTIMAAAYLATAGLTGGLVLLGFAAVLTKLDAIIENTLPPKEQGK